MKQKLFLSICLMFVFIACENDAKKTKIGDQEITKQTEKSATIEEKKVTLDDQIKTIKTNFTTIENQLSELDKKTTTESFSGVLTTLEGYFKHNKPVKIIKSEVAEHTAKETTYYFHNNVLFFVFEQEYSKAPLHEPYTGKEKRFYIVDEKLIKVLTKEKTVKTGKLEMNNVANVDVTAEWKNKPLTVANYVKTAHQVSGALLETAIGLDNGRWLSKDDQNSGIEIKDGKFIMFTKSTKMESTNAYDYKLSEHEGVEYLTLINSKGEELKYSILEYTDDIFIISYLARGNRLTYEKEK